MAGLIFLWKQPISTQRNGGDPKVAEEVAAGFSPVLKTDYRREKVMAAALLFMGYQIANGRR